MPLPKIRSDCHCQVNATAMPAPEGDVQLLFDDRGQLTLLRQSGWEIRYDRWQAFVPGLPPLPARITALKEDKRVRLVVADWQALEATP